MKAGYHQVLRFCLTLLKAIYLFLPGIIFLLAYYFIIVKIDIGQDMLMQAYENDGPFFWTIVSILAWMLFSWFSSRLISDAYIIQRRPPFRIIFKHFPRLLGFNVAICLQVAILNLPFIHLSSGSLWLVFLFHNALYILLHFAFNAEKGSKQKQRLFIITLIISLAYLIVTTLAIKHRINNEGTAELVPRLMWVLILIWISFLFEIAFVRLIVLRRKAISKGEKLEPEKWEKLSTGWRRSYDVFALVVTAFYIAILLSPSLADRVGAIAITLFAFGLWVGFICILNYGAIKLNVHFWLPLLLLAILYGLIYNPYQVRLEETSTQNLYNNRPGIDSFFSRWVNNPLRHDLISDSDSMHRFKTYLVLADGGASKSGYWVAGVLSKLEDSSSANDKFSTHLFSLAGASGGSVGNAAFYCLQRASMMDHKQVNSYESESRKFFCGDFLSSSFARFLGPDLFRHFFPFIFMDDRAAVLEQSMETISNSKLIGGYFSRPIKEVLDTSGRLPALFINTTNLQSGAPGVVSSVCLDSQITERLDILHLLDTTKKLQDKNNQFKNQIRLSTGVILGARFPYISPAGEIAGKYFVDGGYFDNSGAGITLEVLQYIERKMNSSNDSFYTAYKDKLAFKIIYISNGSDKSSEHDLNPLVNDAAAPLLTVLGTYGMQTNLSNQKLAAFMHNTKLDTVRSPFDKINLPIDRRDSTTYPMNWVISDYNLKRMEKNIKQVNTGEVLGY